MSNNKNSGNIWFIVLLVFGLAMFLQVVGGNKTTSPTAASTVDRSSFEHRYATERFKQEGYSQAESRQAADAVIKFHNAQKNRSK